MLLPRSNPGAIYDLDISLIESGVGYTDDVKRADRIALKIGSTPNARHVSLTNQEVDDLIVMLTYYKKEVWGGS